MWKKILSIVLGLTVLIATALAYGSNRWQSATDEMHANLEGARRPVAPKTYSSDELLGLPAPVQRYFRAVLTDGQPMIVAVTVEHTGTFNMDATGEQWKPFSSTQRVLTQRPGFDWEARVAVMPGLPARVHDAYIAGEGILDASLFGLVPRERAMKAAPTHPNLRRRDLLKLLAAAGVTTIGGYALFEYAQ